MHDRKTSTRATCRGFVFDPAAQAIIRQLAPDDLDLIFFEQPNEPPDGMLAETDVPITVAPVTGAMLAWALRLRFIQKWGTGWEKIDIAAAERHHINVAITAGANANTIAEHALMLMLAVLRRVVVDDWAMRAAIGHPMNSGRRRGVCSARPSALSASAILAGLSRAFSAVSMRGSSISTRSSRRSRSL